MQQILLKDLINRFDQELIKLNYKKNSLKNYRIFWKQLSKFFDQQKQIFFSEQLAYTFLKEHYDITGDESNQYLSRNKQHVRQMVRKLIFFHKHGIIGRMNGVPERKIKNIQYLEILENYTLDCRKRDYANNTCKNLKRSAIDFFHFLETNSMHNSKYITSKNILDYISSLKDGYCYRSIGNILTNLRSFFYFLYEKKYHDRNLVEVLPRQKVQFDMSNLTVWSKESVLQLLKTIDRGNPCGKRDYAIFLLVTLLGIRASDIRNLKLENLNWNNNTIEFVQKKTLQRNCLPLLKDIGWAIIDYLKDGRPKVESPYVFLKHLAPYDRLKEGNCFYHIIKRCIKISGIIPPSSKNIGMHSLRRSLATCLLENQTPLQIISDILGHVNTESTSVYLKTDIDMLRECVLDDPEVANE